MAGEGQRSFLGALVVFLLVLALLGVVVYLRWGW